MKQEEENLKHAILRFQRRKEGREGGGSSILDNKQTNKVMRHTNKQTKSTKEGRVGWFGPFLTTNKQTNRQTKVKDVVASLVSHPTR